MLISTLFHSALRLERRLWVGTRRTTCSIALTVAWRRSEASLSAVVRRWMFQLLRLSKSLCIHVPTPLSLPWVPVLRAPEPASPLAPGGAPTLDQQLATPAAPHFDLGWAAPAAPALPQIKAPRPPCTS